MQEHFHPYASGVDHSTMYIAIASVIMSGLIMMIGQALQSRQISQSSTLTTEREALAIKRKAYASFMASIEEIYESTKVGDTGRYEEASRVLNTELGIIDLISPKRVYQPASVGWRYAKLPRTDPLRDKYLQDLLSVMRDDLGLEESEYELLPAQDDQ